VEAHIHGPIDLRTDVELLVVDAAFRRTAVGSALLELGRAYEIPVQWHCGFRMLARDVPKDFRGPAVRPLAERIASRGIIDAAVIGAAEASLYARPDSWADWGTREEALQHLKQLWHVLVHDGAPVDSTLE
jgi:GNAT superfamily N-acetyltransferase